MNKLWAPWRINYITQKKTKGCIFCKLKRGKTKNDFIIFRSSFSFAVLNKYPYNNGHIMIFPKRHISSIEGLTKKELLDIFGLLIKCKKRLDKVLHPQGYNIGVNIGAVSGAGVAGHLHVHIVPRWKADTNFMPVTSDTKVISQSLQELSRILTKNA